MPISPVTRHADPMPAALMAFAVLIGAAVPSLVSGQAFIAGLVAPAMLCAVIVRPWAAWWHDLRMAWRQPIGIAVLATFVAWLPAVAGSLSPRWSLAVWSSTLAFVVMATLIAGILRRNPAARVLVRRSLVVATVVAVAIALAAVFMASEVLSLVRFQGWMARDAPLGLKGYANALMLVIPAVLWAGARQAGIWRVLAALAVAACLIVIDATGARAAVAGLAAMVVAMAVLTVLRFRSRRIAVAMFLVVAVAVAAAVTFLETYPQPHRSPLIEPYAPLWLIDDHRQVIWSFTVRQFWEAPLFGHGINAIAGLDSAKAFLPGMRVEVLPSHPHNWFLEALAETGVFGTLPLLVVVVLGFAWLVRDYRRHMRSEVLTAIAVSTGYWFSGLFNFSFWAAWWQLSYLLLMAVLLAERFGCGDSARPVSAP